MRVAALYDIHSNLPALEVVLAEVEQAGVTDIVVGGDVLPGPMPRETLSRLRDLPVPVHFIHGNGEMAMLAQLEAARTGEVAYWGTTSGAPLPERLRPIYQWTSQQLEPADEAELATWPKTLRLEIDGLGTVLFCHGTPRSEVEIFTRLTAEERLRPLFDDLQASVIVCGHTHLPFDRVVGRTRVVNAGSVGQPFGEPGAHWLLLGPAVELRRTAYDLAQAAERIRATPYPGADEAARDLLEPPSEQAILELYAPWELRLPG
jgi:predicted phosphodiesterase